MDVGLVMDGGLVGDGVSRFASGLCFDLGGLDGRCAVWICNS